MSTEDIILPLFSSRFKAFKNMTEDPWRYISKSHKIHNQNIVIDYGMMITYENFKQYLQDITDVHGSRMCRTSLDNIAFNPVCEVLYSIYTRLYQQIGESMTEQSKKKNTYNLAMFMSQVCIMTFLCSNIIATVKKYHPKSLFTTMYEMVGCLMKDEHTNTPIIFRTLQEYINCFNVTYNVKIPLIKDANKHSSIGSLKKVQNDRVTTMFENLFGIEEKEDMMWLEVCRATRHRSPCKVLLNDRGQILNALELLFKGKELSFSMTRDGIVISFLCTENMSELKRLKKDDMGAADTCCNNQIIFTKDKIGVCKQKLIINNKPCEFVEVEKQQQILFYKQLLQTHNMTAFPNMQIVFCPSDACSGSYGFVVPHGVQQINCITCHRLFCIRCKFFVREGDHADDGSDCTEALQELMKELGPDIALCPNKFCNTPIGRIDGCDKMKCKCGTTFCWLCQKMTALQQQDLKEIKRHFVHEGKPIHFASSEASFLYIHIESTCMNASYVDGGVFHSVSVLPRWMQDITYTNGDELSLGDSETILIMMQTAIQKNHPV